MAYVNYILRILKIYRNVANAMDRVLIALLRACDSGSFITQHYTVHFI
jgi:hypothetical protein